MDRNIIAYKYTGLTCIYTSDCEAEKAQMC